MNHASLQQLAALGYKAGDRVWIRCLAGKGFNIVADGLFPFDGYLTLKDSGYSFTRLYSQQRGGGEKFTTDDGIGYLRQQNARGYGVYLVVNAGGRRDDQIERCPGFFYECDNVPKDEQWQRIKRLPLTPSVVIDTRNSLHVYYLTKEQDKAEWRNYQKRLIQLMDSDASIHNESRLMRLAGFDHQKAGAEPYPITISAFDQIDYSRSQFDDILPALDDARWPTERAVITEEEKQKRLEIGRRRRETLAIADGFPLEICLSKSHRDLIASGVSEGGRNKEGYALLVDLLATADYLNSSGYQFVNSPEILFDEFCDRCSPPISDRERQLIWRSASTGTHTPSLTPDAIENCIKGWQKRENKYLDYSFDKTIKVIEKHEKEITAEESQSLFLQAFGSFGGVLKKTFNNLTKKREKHPYIPTPEGNPDETIYIKLNQYDNIPTPDQYRGQKIILQTKGLSDEQKSRHRANVYELAARLGYKGLLDTSHCGSGKSHAMGEINPYRFYLEKDGEPQKTRSIIYTSPQPRNPTTVAIEEQYTEMPTRHSGYVTDGYKLTPAGNPIRYRPQSDDIDLSLLIGENNCINHTQFIALRGHGQATKGLCGTCPMVEQCKKGTGKGYGFLFEMFTTLANARNVRAHPLSLSTEMVSGKVVINDEFTISYQPTFRIEITKGQLLEEMTKAIAAIPSLSSIAGSLLKLAGLTDPDDSHKKFGYDTREVLATLGELPDNIAEIIAGVRFWEEQENELLLIPDEDGKYPESKPRWLSTLLTIWKSGQSDKLAGAISVNRKIALSVKNTDPADLFDAAYYTVYQDATTTPSRLALLLGVETTAFLWVAEEPPVLDNLTIQPVNVGALCGNDRSEELQKRIDIIRNSDRFKDVPTIEYKKYAHPSDLIHGSDARGSNAFEGKEELAVIGLYRKNMSAVLDEYVCLTGHNISIADTDHDFCKYYSDGNFAELIQSLGRNRAARYPDKPFTVTIFDDGLSTQGLENFGYKVNPTIGIEEVCPEASPKGTNLYYRIMLFLGGEIDRLGKGAIDQIKKVSQKEVATACGCSIARLKQVSANLEGGWTTIIKGIVALINISKGRLDLTAEMDKCGFSKDDLAFLYGTYIPMLRGQYGYDPEGTFEEVKVLLDSGILYAEGLPPSQAAWILYVIFRKLISLSDMPAIVAMFSPETEFA